MPALGYDAVYDAGTLYEMDYPSSRHGTPIHCSQPCIAVQYAKEAQSGAPMLPFMLVLTPREHYSRDVVFSSPSWVTETTEIALSLMVDFFPVDDLYLDGVSLDYLDWQIAADATGAFATVSIEPGKHQLYTLDPEHG